MAGPPRSRWREWRLLHATPPAPPVCAQCDGLARVHIVIHPHPAVIPHVIVVTCPVCRDLDGRPR